MDVYVSDTKMETLSVIDNFNSLIWTDRYYQNGDFELYMPITESLLNAVKQDYYLRIRDSEHVMIVEKILIEADSENGARVTISGRSLESILDRRIAWGSTVLKGNLQDALEKLLTDNIINPTDEKRKIENFVFKRTEDERITSLTIDAQYLGEDIYTIVYNTCSEKEIGFKITLNDLNQFVFELYIGEDRTYDQVKNPYVVFSPKFDNMISSNYIESKSSWKNVTLVGGDTKGESSDRYYVTVGDVSGLSRREIFTDARGTSRSLSDGGEMSDSEYESQLKQKGKETLKENSEVHSFEGEMETTILFKYGIDFFNGDVVQIEDQYGHNNTARILEIVFSEDETGFSVYPTFSAKQEIDGLPDIYEEVEYVELNGKECIDIQYKPNNNTEISCDFELIQNSSNTVGLFGSRNVSGGSVGSFCLWFISNKFSFYYGSNITTSETKAYARYKIDIKKNVLYVDDVEEFRSEESSFQTNYDFLIGSINNAGNPDSRASHIKIYSFYVKEHGSTMSELVPCKNKTEETYGLYDKIRKNFYKISSI